MREALFLPAALAVAQLLLWCIAAGAQDAREEAANAKGESEAESQTSTSIRPWLNVSALPVANWFPDFDCLDLTEGDEVYELVSGLAYSVVLHSKTGWATTSGIDPNEEVYARYAEKLDQVSSLFKTACPFAHLAARVAQWLACSLAPANSAACSSLKVWFGSELIAVADELSLPHSLAFITFANTRWVWACQEIWFAASRAAESGILQVEVDILSLVHAFDACEEEGADTGWPWSETRARFKELDLELSMHNGAAENLQEKMLECPMGVVAIVLGRIHTLSTSLSEDLEGQSALLMKALALLESMMLHATGGRIQPLLMMIYSDWPIADLWALNSQLLAWKKEGKLYQHYQHKPYRMEFRDEELVRPFKQDLLYRLRLPSEAMLKVLAQDLRRVQSPIHRSLTHALWTVQHLTNADAGPNRLVLLAMVYSDRIARFLPGYLARAEAFNLLRKFIVACQDEASHAICSRGHRHRELCVQGNIPSTFSKYTAMTAILQAGFGVLYLDFDIILMQDPLPYILKRAEEAEIVVSRDFGSECINTGVTYVKAHPDSVDFMERLLIWLWHHPYEFCQKAFAGLLGVEDLARHDLDGRPYHQIPRWKMLDHVNQFVTSTIYDPKAQGWTGELEKIVIYHFLDGLGTVNKAVANRTYVDLNVLFFDNPLLNLTDTSTPLWEQDPRVKEQLEWSRQPHAIPAEELLPCVLFEYEAWPDWKKNQRIEALKVWAAAAS